MFQRVLEERLESAIQQGHLDEAEELNKQLVQCDFASKIVRAVECRDYVKRKVAEGEKAKKKKKTKLHWGFEQKQRWESKGNMWNNTICHLQSYNVPVLQHKRTLFATYNRTMYLYFSTRGHYLPPTIVQCTCTSAQEVAFPEMMRCLTKVFQVGSEIYIVALYLWHGGLLAAHHWIGITSFGTEVRTVRV